MGAAAELMRLLKRKRKKVDIEPLLQQITAEEGITLSKTQEQAVRQVFQYPVSIITGGPGTGKTTFDSHYHPNSGKIKQRFFNFALCADRACQKAYV